MWRLLNSLARLLFIGVIVSALCLPGQMHSPLDLESLPKEYFVRGTVVAIHAKTAAITIRGSNLIGYLRFRQKSYRVRQPEALKTFRPGDQVKAVYSLRDRKIYHLVHVAPTPAKRIVMREGQSL